MQVQPLKLYIVPQQWCLYGTYVSDVTGNLYEIVRTGLQTLMALPAPLYPL